MFLVLIDCSGNSADDRLSEINGNNLERVVNLYYSYQKAHNWVGTPNESAFRTYVEEFDPVKLKRIGIEPGQTSKVFFSERDGQPFRIRYGVMGSMMGSNKAVVFEAVGEGGKRWVGFLDNHEEAVDESEFDRLWLADDGQDLEVTRQ